MHGEGAEMQTGLVEGPQSLFRRGLGMAPGPQKGVPVADSVNLAVA